VALGVWVGTGSRAEPPPLGGCAHFIEHLLFKGTPRRSASVLAREIDAIGGHLDAFTAREYTCFYLNILVEHIERGMDILSDILINSTFPALEIERERRVILEEIKMSEDNPEDCVYELLVSSIWPRNPLGRPILGAHSSITSMGRTALLSFFRRHYRSGNLVFASAGGVSHGRLEKLWKKYFPLPRSRAIAPHGTAPRFRKGFFRKARDLEQTHLCFGTRGLSQTHRDRYALHVLNSIFGGSMSSRLFQEIREKRGLAYSVFSSHSAYRDTGLFTVSVGTSPELARRVVRLVEGQMGKICSRLPSQREVARAKEHIRGNVILGLESNGNRMMSLAKQELFFKRLHGIDETIEAVEAVTPKKVQEVAGRLFAEGGTAWAAVGPGQSLEKLVSVRE
jgi:predicted Zn-dependent peptidase